MERIREALDRAAAERDAAATTRPAPDAPLAARAGVDTAARITRVLPRDDAALARHRVRTGEEDDATTRAIKRLRTRVLQHLRTSDRRTLALTTPRSGGGTTWLTVNLAISLARELEHHVCLVDLNWQRPAVASHFGVQVEHTLIDVLEGSAALPEVLFATDLPRLVVLPGGRAGPRAAELLASGAVAALVAELRLRYPDRFVLFDLPPLLGYDDALAFLPNADALLLVARAGHTTREDTRTALDLLAGMPLLGVALNDCPDETD